MAEFTLALDAYQMSDDDGKNIIFDSETSSNDQLCKHLELNCEDDAYDAWKESFEWVINKDLKVR